jgi:hypothetical protein
MPIQPIQPIQTTEVDWACFEGVVPEQVLTQAQELPARGTRALMFAVLEEAIMCLTCRPASVGRSRRPTIQLALQAERWVRSEDQRWPFSFENVCAALELDAAGLRAALLRAARTPRAVELRRSHRVHAAGPLTNQATPRRFRDTRAAVAPPSAIAAKPDL